MSEFKSKSGVQGLLNALLWDIYGRVSARTNSEAEIFQLPAMVHLNAENTQQTEHANKSSDLLTYSHDLLRRMDDETLFSILAALRLEVRLYGMYLAQQLMQRDKIVRQRTRFSDVITAHLHALSDKSTEAGEMRFSLPPPPPTPGDQSQLTKMGISNATSDFNQWLHAMKMVARLAGGMPPEFRKKLWLVLSDRYISSKGVNWKEEEAKCLSEQWRTDDEELGIQIVKDLHRTGSSLCSGPAGSLNQAKLKRVLLGYARWNPEVGYCQGFNMLGALILQVMDKNEVDSIKVMIYLIEGVLPSGYFCGSLGGLQADMAVFREILGTRLPRLAKHLQKLQGPIGEASFEPPLTNVFTMQWFLTLFCTCLPLNCVLRIWDLILIEGSDVLLRTGLAIWMLLEEKIIHTRTADDFYCTMGILSGELLNGSLIDSNGLIQRIVELGPVTDLQKLRDKHRYNIAPWREKKGLKIFYSDDEGDSDDDSRLAITAAWGIRVGRRGSLGLSSSSRQASADNSKDRIALDISILKNQYTKLRERQRQAHIILTAACARQPVAATSSTGIQMNQLLLGKNAILSNKGRRIGPPQGTIPPARKSTKSSPKQTKRGETLHWKDTDTARRRKNSIKWKDVPLERRSSRDEIIVPLSDLPLSKSPSTGSILSNVSESSQHSSSSLSKHKSESSSYSEDEDATSSTSTSLCDDEQLGYNHSETSAESPLHKKISPCIEVPDGGKTEILKSYVDGLLLDESNENELTGTMHLRTSLCTEDQILIGEVLSGISELNLSETVAVDKCDSSTGECDRFSKSKSLERLLASLGDKKEVTEITQNEMAAQPAPACVRASSSRDSFKFDQMFSMLDITSTSQLSPIADISKYLNTCSISPLKTPSPTLDFTDFITTISRSPSEEKDIHLRETLSASDKCSSASDEGVTNQLFERINARERPSKLELTGISFRPLDKYTDLAISARKFDVPEATVSPGLRRTLSPTILPSPKIDVDIELDDSVFDDRIMKNFKSKSLSMDEPAVLKEKFQPISCPEALSDVEAGRRNSDRALKIIQENSMILHRILKKSTIDKSEENLNSEAAKESELLGIIDPIEEILQVLPDNDECSPQQKPANLIVEQKHNDIPIIKQPQEHTHQQQQESQPQLQLQQPQSESQSQSHSREEKKVFLLSELLDVCRRESRETQAALYKRDSSLKPTKSSGGDTGDDAAKRISTSDSNISATLSSIQNTIRSIDSLCQDRESYATLAKITRSSVCEENTLLGAGEAVTTVHIHEYTVMDDEAKFVKRCEEFEKCMAERDSMRFEREDPELSEFRRSLKRFQDDIVEEIEPRHTFKRTMSNRGRKLTKEDDKDSPPSDIIQLDDINLAQHTPNIVTTYPNSEFRKPIEEMNMSFDSKVSNYKPKSNLITIDLNTLTNKELIRCLGSASPISTKPCTLALSPFPAIAAVEKTSPFNRQSHHLTASLNVPAQRDYAASSDHIRFNSNILVTTPTSPAIRLNRTDTADYHKVQSCDNIPSRVTLPLHTTLPVKQKSPSDVSIKLGLYQSPTSPKS